jgi:hypothetical protein
MLSEPCDNAEEPTKPTGPKIAPPCKPRGARATKDAQNICSTIQRTENPCKNWWPLWMRNDLHIICVHFNNRLATRMIQVHASQAHSCSQNSSRMKQNWSGLSNSGHTRCCKITSAKLEPTTESIPCLHLRTTWLYTLGQYCISSLVWRHCRQ